MSGEPPEVDYATAAAGRQRTTYVVVTLAMLGALFLLVWLLGGIGVLFWIPLAAWFVSRWLVAGGSLLHGWSRRRIWAEAQGRHHAFDDVWVRIEAAGDGSFRVRAEDVFRVLEEQRDDLACRKLAARLAPAGLIQDGQRVWWFSEKAVLVYLRERAGRHDDRAWRFCLWLEREVLPPLRRQAERRAEE